MTSRIPEVTEAIAGAARDGCWLPGASSPRASPKYDASGVHQWSQRFGGDEFEGPRGIAVDGAGNVIVTGTCSGAVDFGGGALIAADHDIFVAKYDASGTH